MAKALVSVKLLLREPAWRRTAVALATLLLLSLFYCFQATAGTFKALNWKTNYYDLLCEGFRQGHLYIPVAPSPELLAKADPFNVENIRLWLWDATLFNRHYYMYWGPVPALCLWLFKAVAGYEGEIIDQWITLAFMLGRLWAGGVLILSVANHVRTRLPAWLVGLAILVFGMAAPTTYNLGTPLIYQANLAAGQCFLFWGMVAAYWGVIQTSRRMPWFVLAGVLWGGAFGSRVSLVVPVPLLVLLTGLLVWRGSGRDFRSLLRSLLALGIPVGMAMGAYALYNYERFASVTQFGMDFQVSGQRFHGNPSHVVPNLWSYLFAEVEWSCKFPFVIELSDQPLPRFITRPPGYSRAEPVSGMLVTCAWCWLLMVWVWHPLQRLRSWVSGRPLLSQRRLSTPELWMILCSLAIGLAIVPALPNFEGLTRYLQDPIGGALMAATMAAVWLLRRADGAGIRGARIGIRLLVIALGVHTVFVGLFLGLPAYRHYDATANPALYQKLGEALSLCADPQP